MSLYRILWASLVLLAPTIFSACDRNTIEPPLPAATAENCIPEVAERIKDIEARKKFLTNCALRDTYKPSKPRGW